MMRPRLPPRNATRKSSAGPAVRDEHSTATGPVYGTRSRLGGGQIVSDGAVSQAPAESGKSLPRYAGRYCGVRQRDVRHDVHMFYYLIIDKYLCNAFIFFLLKLHSFFLQT